MPSFAAAAPATGLEGPFLKHARSLSRTAGTRTGGTLKQPSELPPQWQSRMRLPVLGCARTVSPDEFQNLEQTLHWGTLIASSIRMRTYTRTNQGRLVVEQPAGLAGCSVSEPRLMDLAQTAREQAILACQRHLSAARFERRDVS